MIDHSLLEKLDNVYEKIINDSHLSKGRKRVLILRIGKKRNIPQALKTKIKGDKLLRDSQKNELKNCWWPDDKQFRGDEQSEDPGKGNIKII